MRLTVDYQWGGGFIFLESLFPTPERKEQVLRTITTVYPETIKPGEVVNKTSFN